MSDSLPKQKNLISISQAAKFLGVSIDTIRRWDNSGVLHSSRPDGKNRYFSLSELEEHKSTQPLSISEAAKQLGISPTTLRRLESRGLLKPSRNNAGERIYDKDSLKNFQNSDYFRRKNHDNDYLLKRKPIQGTISEPLNNEDLPQERIALKTHQNDSDYPEEESNPLFNRPSRRIPEILASIVIFILLSSIGVTNITLSATQRLQSAQNPVVLSETTHEKPVETSVSAQPTEAEKEATATESAVQSVNLDSIQSLIDDAANLKTKEEKAAEDEGGGPGLGGLKVILLIKTSGAASINIRERPSTESGIIDEAKDGDLFEMVSRESDWYEIKLDNNLTGFISEKFAQIKEINQ